MPLSLSTLRDVNECIRLKQLTALEFPCFIPARPESGLAPVALTGNAVPDISLVARMVEMLCEDAFKTKNPSYVKVSCLNAV